MTTASARTDFSKLALKLDAIFAFDSTGIQRLAGLLSTGQITLTQRKVELAPYVGPAAKQLAEIRRLAKGGNALARHELQAIAQHHDARRTKPLLEFISQFPAEWRRALFVGIRDTVVGIELKAGSDNRVVEVLGWRSPFMFEYSLRGFLLTFEQAVEIANWMRANEDLLPSTTLSMPALVKGDDAIEGARWASLTTFFDNFPERYRILLAKKAAPQLRRIRFQEEPTGEIKMVLSA